MDSNRQQPYLLCDARHWALHGVPAVAYDERKRVLRLASTRPRLFTEVESLARTRVTQVPEVIDRFGTRARWDAPTRRVLASGAPNNASEVSIYNATPGWPVTDLCVGHDDVLYMIAGGRLVMLDLHQRFEIVDRIPTEGFTGFRLAPAPTRGVFVLDRVFHHLALFQGLPMRPLRGVFAPSVFRPDPEDGDPPRGRILSDAIVPSDEETIAIATSAEGRLALLTWVNGSDARLRILGPDERFGPPQVLRGARFPYSLAWLSEDKVAVLLATNGPETLNEALVYLLPQQLPVTEEHLPLGDLHPLREHTGGPFMHGAGGPPRYPSARGPLPLQPLAWPSYAPTSTVRAATSLDSGHANTVWHRLYLEAVIPKGCGVRVWLATSSTRTAPEASSEWHEHHFGTVPATETPEVPRGNWLRERSEIPLHPGLLACPRRRDEAGLFQVLIQRANRRVRQLVGRHLWVRVELLGDGRSTPEVAAIRAYASRQSYSNYLPQLYRETLFGPEANEVGASTRADFLDRFLATFESVLTPLEDRIGRADLLTDPRTTPDEALEWLASWVGFGFQAALPIDRRRAMLTNMAELYRRRGTKAGLELALDLATGGACQRGQVVVVEDYRLRRTFATILGADLADEADPLLPGIAVSGNSYVGDTLVIGNEHQAEFLAVFAPEVAQTPRERKAVAELFDRLAHRVTVLIARDLPSSDAEMIGALSAQNLPAHIQLSIVSASEGLLVGVTSLVGVDTFPVRREPPQPVRADVSHVGRKDLIEHLPSLDPRLGEPGHSQPTATISAIAPTHSDTAFTLNGSASRPAAGQRLVRFHWMLVR